MTTQQAAHHEFSRPQPSGIGNRAVAAASLCCKETTRVERSAQERADRLPYEDTACCTD
ncbi:hypothetical protein [Lutibaculum baratangense]|uniref:Uncharacterized protein n=1 Tax=Lutibaculum baratangense AMV1 TaxID=631454 RepID=V4RNE9_9HYPH|nr:hypothetical protein [Lutibaculum baratangense]ESR24735.1 hypothetical protein N177_2058 [Lutibaculum baratangense AMV1]